jgi:hypothetical protein
VVPFFIELSTRRGQSAGISTRANWFWMSRIARNLTDAVDEILKRKCYSFTIGIFHCSRRNTMTMIGLADNGPDSSFWTLRGRARHRLPYF